MRPDLTDEEARRVAEKADQDFDSNVGVNWEVLESHADWLFPKRLVEGRMVEQTSGKELTPVVIDFSSGYIFCATFAGLQASKNRHEFELSAMSHSRKLKLDGVIVVYLPDGKFVDLDVESSYQFLHGDTEALLACIRELRDAEATAGKKFIQEMGPRS